MRPLQRTFKGVQALRGIAACMVVIFHITQLWSYDFGPPARTWFSGESGVDIFFVISGFVMTISQKDTTAAEFMRRRVVRIFPLYWIFTAITLAKLIAVKVDPNMGSNVSHVQTTLGYILSSFFLIPFRNSLGSLFPILVVGWTLSFEMFFYLLIACSIFLGMNKTKFLTAAIIPLAIVGIFYNDSWPAILSLTRPFLLEFLAGVFLAQAVRRGLEVNPYACSFMLLAGSIGIRQNYAHGLSSVLIVVAVVLLEDHLRVPSWVLVIGESSYSIYLVHYLIVQAICRVVIWQASNKMSETPCVYLCISASLLAGIIVHYVLELPITSALNRGSRNLFGSDRLVGLPAE